MADRLPGGPISSVGHVNSLRNFDLAPDGKWVAVFSWAGQSATALNSARCVFSLNCLRTVLTPTPLSFPPGPVFGNELQ